MIIKVLGPGCRNCLNLERATRQAVEGLGLTATIEKITATPPSWATASWPPPRSLSTRSSWSPAGYPPRARSATCSLHRPGSARGIQQDTHHRRSLARRHRRRRGWGLRASPVSHTAGGRLTGRVSRPGGCGPQISPGSPTCTSAVRGRGADPARAPDRSPPGGQPVETGLGAGVIAACMPGASCPPTRQLLPSRSALGECFVPVVEPFDGPTARDPLL